MRWFKHLTNASDDEVMSELIDEFGVAAYGVWWIILEKIAAQMDETNRCFIRFSLKKWSKSCGISSKKFQNIVKFLQKNNKIFSKLDGVYLTIGCDNLLKFRDEYSKKKKKKSSKSPDKIQTDSGQCPRQDTDTDTDTDTDIKKNIKKKKTPPKKFIPPSEFEVIKYFDENGYTKQSAINAFKYYQEGDWIDSRGNKVKNWKQKMRANWFKPGNQVNLARGQPNLSKREQANRQACIEFANE